MSMFVVLGWYAARPLDQTTTDQLRQRAEQAMHGILPESYVRHRLGGEGWGLHVAHAAEWGHWRWPVLERSENLTAVSMGVPLGIDTTGGPQRLAGQLLAGQDVHAGVVPPFALLAGDDDQWVVQQDWLGMARVFTGTAEGVDVVATRPGLVTQALGMAARPDRDGWASYVACGHFAADSSPYAGVRQLTAGQRLTWRRMPGGWKSEHTARRNVDDVIVEGLAARGRHTMDGLLDLAAAGLTAATSGLYRLYDAPVVLGLSGGRDSRLIAATLLAAGTVPRFRTNIDTPAEGQIAGRLVELLRSGGQEVEHELQLVAAPQEVGTVGLHERVRRLQRVFDYQYPSTYTIRRPGPGRLAERVSASFTGAGGELVTAYWHPKGNYDDASRAAARKGIRHRLFAACASEAVAADVRHAEDGRLNAVLDHGENLGLRGVELCDYLYLVERVRRWYVSAYAVGMVTPYLAPGFVAASFALTPADKRARAVHEGLIRRFVPQWADVPYVSMSTGVSTAARIWDGDGLPAAHQLLETAGGDLTHLMHGPAVARTIAACAEGFGNDKRQRVLQQYACLAMASLDMQPGTTRPATQAYEQFLATRRRNRPPSQRIPTPLRPLAQRLRRTRIGRVLSGWLHVIDR
jgi:hypothetical protein